MVCTHNGHAVVFPRASRQAGDGDGDGRVGCRWRPTRARRTEGPVCDVHSRILKSTFQTTCCHHT